MELSNEVTSAIVLLAKVSEQEFTGAIQECAQHIAQLSNSSTINTTGLRCQTPLLTLLLEAAKRNYSHDQLVRFLEDLSFELDRLKSITKLYEKNLSTLRHRLICINSTMLSHVVDLDWKLQQEVTNGPGLQNKEASYLLKFTILQPGSTSLEHMTLQCSVPQMVAITASLRQAKIAMTKLS